MIARRMDATAPPHHRITASPFLPRILESEHDRCDLNLRGGTVHDNLGSAAPVADLAVKDGLIAAIDMVTGTATEALDAALGVGSGPLRLDDPGDMRPSSGCLRVDADDHVASSFVCHIRRVVQLGRPPRAAQALAAHHRSPLGLGCQHAVAASQLQTRPWCWSAARRRRRSAPAAVLQAQHGRRCHGEPAHGESAGSNRTKPTPQVAKTCQWRAVLDRRSATNWHCETIRWGAASGSLAWEESSMHRVIWAMLKPQIRSASLWLQRGCRQTASQALPGRIWRSRGMPTWGWLADAIRPRSLSGLGRRKREAAPARTVFAGFAGP